MEEIIEAIKAKRKELKISQKELAAMVGVSSVTIVNMEQNKNVAVKTVIDSCAKLGMRVGIIKQ